jgi:conjugative transfer signal peptidase TraF
MRFWTATAIRHRLQMGFDRLWHLRRIRYIVYATGILWGTAPVLWLTGMRINVTPSLPLGFYQKTIQPSNLVIFCPEGWVAAEALARHYVPSGSCPAGSSPILKRVVAHPGDTVSYSEQGITVNGNPLPNTAPLAEDRTLHLNLNHYPFGTYCVQPNEVWVASTYDPRSFDSRYYGPIPKTQIQSFMIARWTFQ